MPEYYRGGTRSPYGAQWWTGSLSITPNGSSTTMLTSVALTKMKRVQVVCMLQKDASPSQGYLAFYREFPDTTTNVNGLSITNPQVLRPKVFVTNPDHAIYVEMYLEAITLDVGEKLHLFGDIATGASGISYMTAKWYAERQLHI